MEGLRADVARLALRVRRARLRRDRDGLFVFLVCIILFRVAAAVYLLADLLVAAAPVVMLASGITVPGPTTYARAIYRDTNSLRSDVHEAVAISEGIVRTARRVFGREHPYFAGYQEDLEGARMRLADDESREA